MSSSLLWEPILFQNIPVNPVMQREVSIDFYATVMTSVVNVVYKERRRAINEFYFQGHSFLPSFPFIPLHL
jgi:hypothetical protein